MGVSLLTLEQLQTEEMQQKIQEKAVQGWEIYTILLFDFEIYAQGQKRQNGKVAIFLPNSHFGTFVIVHRFQKCIFAK